MRMLNTKKLFVRWLLNRGDYFEFLEAQGTAQAGSSSGAQAAATMGKALRSMDAICVLKSRKCCTDDAQRMRSMSTIQQRYIASQIAAFSERNLKPLEDHVLLHLSKHLVQSSKILQNQYRVQGNLLRASTLLLATMYSMQRMISPLVLRAGHQQLIVSILTM